MKELEVNIQMNRAEHVQRQTGAGLTPNSNPSTLEVKGNIMDSGNENTPVNPTEKRLPHVNPNQETGFNIQPTKFNPLPQEKVQELWEEKIGKKIGDLPPGDEEAETIRFAIEMGIPPGLPPIAGASDTEPITVENTEEADLQKALFKGIDLEGITDQEFLSLGQVWNRRMEAGGVDPDILDRLWEKIQEMQVSPERIEQKNLALERINEKKGEIMKKQISGRKERFGLYLESDDIKTLMGDEGPTKWINEQFDRLYALAQEGQELNSPIVNNMQSVVSEAIRWLQYNKPKELEKFQQLFTIRFNLLQMRTSMGYRNIESIQKAAYTLQVHGLMYGLSLEDGKVGQMFNRIHELVEDERLRNSEHHVTPEIINGIQQKIIDEQIVLKEKGIGSFADLSDADILRTVRTAYDVFVSSQRLAVIVARGRHLKDAKQYFSDPASGPLNVYNIEDLLTAKYGIFNVHEEEFLDEMKLDLAQSDLKARGIKSNSISHEEKIVLGTKLFRDLFAVPDFFSSGWRIQGMLESMEDRIGREKAKDFGLFMRLKDPRKPDDGGMERKDVWRKIASYRPEEIIRLYRERDNDSLSGLYDEMKTIDRDLVLTPEETTQSLTVYDKFKDKYGNVLRSLREKEFHRKNDNGRIDPRQINFSQMSDKQKAELNKAFNDPMAAEKVSLLFGRMQVHISSHNLIDQLTDKKNKDYSKFEDIYTRTITVDDALLHLMESKDEKGEIMGEDQSVTLLSQRYSTDQGGDALVRIWNDTANANKAQGALIGFIKSEKAEEKIKHALEFADSTSQYNGELARAKCVRFTAGTFLALSKSDFLMDALGVSKLPLRLPMSRIEEIYGPQAKPMSRDELRVQLDHLTSVLVGHAETEKDKKDAEAFIRELEVLFEVTGKDYAKRKSIALLIFILVAAAAEAYEVSGLKQAGKR